MGALRKKGSEVPSQWWPPATDLELERERWEAPDCTRRVMSEGTMHRCALGCFAARPKRQHMGLEGGEVTDGREHEGANGSGAVEEGANGRLEETAVGGGGEGGGIYGSYDAWGAVEPKTGEVLIMGESRGLSLTDSGTTDLSNFWTQPPRERDTMRLGRS